MNAVRPSALTIAVLMLSAAVGFDWWHAVTPVPLAHDFASFPDRIGQWHTAPLATFRSELELLDFDDELSKNYVAPDGFEVNIFVGYFREQRQDRELAGYRIREILGNASAITYDASPAGPRVTDFITTSHNETFHVTHVYAIGRTFVAGDVQAKLHTAWNSMVHGRTDGAVVAVKARVKESTPLEQARARVSDFLRGALGALERHWKAD